METGWSEHLREEGSEPVSSIRGDGDGFGNLFPVLLVRERSLTVEEGAIYTAPFLHAR